MTIMSLRRPDRIMAPPHSIHLYRDIETFDDFSQVVDPSIYDRPGRGC